MVLFVKQNKLLQITKAKSKIKPKQKKKRQKNPKNPVAILLNQGSCSPPHPACLVFLFMIMYRSLIIRLLDHFLMLSSRQVVAWHRPYCVDLEESTFSHLRSFLERYCDKINSEIPPLPFPSSRYVVNMCINYSLNFELILVFLEILSILFIS